MGDLDPSLIRFPGPSQVHNRNGISIRSAVFAQLTTLLSGMPGMPSLLKIAPSHRGCPSNTWFLEPTRAHYPNGTLIGSAVFVLLSLQQ